MTKRYDIVALGELNIDLILNDIQGFPEIGKEIIADHCTMTLGSSTAIFAANASSLGTKVAFLGLVGTDDFGDFIERSLRERGVDTGLLLRTSEHNSGITVCMSYAQDRANVTFPGSMNYLGYEQVKELDFSCAKHVHISSVFLQEQLKKDLVPILKHIRQGGATISMDTQWDPAEKWDIPWNEVLPLLDVFMPNAQELEALTGETDLEKAIAAVSGKVKTLVVKNGSKGSIMVSDGVRRAVPALLNPEPVDCIGAGDSFNAGFVAAFVKGCSLPDCQDNGNLTGAISTTAAGGTGAFSSPEAIEAAAKRFRKESAGWLCTYSIRLR